MKHILALLLFILTTPILSQTVQDNNTLIILYEEEELNVKSSYANFYNIPLDEKGRKDINKLFFRTNKVSFVYKTFRDFDYAERKDSTFTIKVNKSFLKKNKDMILTKDDFNKMDRSELFSMLDQNRNIFLIDKNEIIDDKLIMREVVFNYPYSIE